MDSFILKKLKEVDGKEQYWVDSSSRFVALENIDDDVDINRTWETITLHPANRTS
jgi:hypothetical protein